MFRLGLIGAGRWGQRYISTIHGIEGVELVHLGSANPASQSLVKPSCKVSREWHDVATDQSLNGVIVATPPALHAEMAKAALVAGVAVLIEKPLTLSLSEAKDILATSVRTKCLAMVGHTHLFSNAFLTLKRDGCKLGALQKIRSRGGNWGPWRPDTPMLWDWAPHDLAMCLDLTGTYPDRIFGTLHESGQSAGVEGELREFRLEFPGGVVADIHVSNIDAQKSRYFEATFELGSLVYDDLASDKLCFLTNNGVHRAIPLPASFPLTNLVTEFCQQVTAGQCSHPSLELGLQVVKLIERLETASITGHVL